MDRIFDYVIVITARFDPLCSKGYIFFLTINPGGRDVEISRETEIDFLVVAWLCEYDENKI